MTPLEVLEEVKTRFTVLLPDDEEVLLRLLRRSLGKYQDKAGVILEAWQEADPCFLIPPHYHAVAGACDVNRKFIPWRYSSIEVEETVEDEDGNPVTRTTTVPTILLSPYSRNKPPYCLYYFADLRNWPDEEDLPGDCLSLLSDYLEALIDVQNADRLRNAYLTAGMNDNAQGLLSPEETRQRVTEIETMMEENKAIVPPASMF